MLQILYTGFLKCFYLPNLNLCVILLDVLKIVKMLVWWLDVVCMGDIVDTKIL